MTRQNTWSGKPSSGTSTRPSWLSNVARSLARYVRCCTEAGVAYRVLEGIGTPYVQILMEAQRYDVIVLGHHTHFQFGSEAEPDVTLSKVLAASPRPVVAMPDKLRDGEAVLIAYDGSLQAARALAAFESSGLGQGRPVHVVSVADSKKEAERCSKRAVEFLRLHRVEAEACPVESVQSPVEVILDSIEMVDAGLLVMGAYGQPVLRDFFLGSVTRGLLEKCHVPMFLFH